MKTYFYLFVFTLFSACISTYASLLIQIPSSQDDPSLKYSLWKEPDIAESIEIDRKKLYELEEVLRTKKESELKKAFGRPQSLNDTYVLPFCRHTVVGFSGLGYKGEEKMYFLPIGDVGGVLVFPYGDRDYVSAVALYLKLDNKFVPVKNQEDYKMRRTWDKKTLDELKKLIFQKIKNTEQGAAPNTYPHADACGVCHASCFCRLRASRT